MKTATFFLSCLFWVYFLQAEDSPKKVQHAIDWNIYSFYFFSADVVDEYGTENKERGMMKWDTGLRYILMISKVFGFNAQANFHLGKTNYKSGAIAERGIGLQGGAGTFIENKKQWLYLNINAGISRFNVPELNGQDVNNGFYGGNNTYYYTGGSTYKHGYQAFSRTAPYLNYGIGLGKTVYYFFDHMMVFKNGVHQEFRTGILVRFRINENK